MFLSLVPTTIENTVNGMETTEMCVGKGTTEMCLLRPQYGTVLYTREQTTKLRVAYSGQFEFEFEFEFLT